MLTETAVTKGKGWGRGFNHMMMAEKGGEMDWCGVRMCLQDSGGISLRGFCSVITRDSCARQA
jgi:hypothetical protein